MDFIVRGYELKQMDSDPKISVIIPLYNKRSTILRAVNSVLFQSHKNLELIIVDDGSNDGSLELLRTLSDWRIRIISQTNQGPGAARNRGARAAVSDFLAFLDADDEWLPDYLKTAGDIIFSDSTLACITSAYLEYPGAKSSGEYWQTRGIKSGPVKIDSTTTAQALLAQLAFMSPCTTLIRRSCFERFDGFYAIEKCTYGEDAYLFLKVLANYKCFNLLEPLAKLHFENSSLSNARLRKRDVEPFLSHCDEIIRACPTNLIDLFKRALALRAFKTSCVLSAWGEWRAARALRSNFLNQETEKLELATLSFLAANPIGSALSKLARKFL